VEDLVADAEEDAYAMLFGRDGVGGYLAAFLYLADDEPAAPTQRAKRAITAAPVRRTAVLVE
jgi:hypothetical protein